MANVGNLVVDMTLDSSKFSSSLKKAESEATASASKIEGTFTKLGGAIATGLAVAGAAAVTAGGASVRYAADQEAAFMRVNKVMDIAVDKQDAFKSSIRDLSNKYGQSTEDIARSSATLAASGRYKNIEELVAGTETLIKASTAWNMGAEQTADYLTQIANGYNMTNDQVARYSSSVAELADASGANEEQLIRGNIAMMGLRKEFGMGIDDVNGMTAAFAEMGVQPEMMATAFRSMFTVFTSGSKPALEAMAELGITQEEYNQAVREGKLPEFFAKVSQKLGTVTNEYKRAALAGDLFGSYGRNLANKLPDAMGKVTEYTQISTRAFQENTRTTIEAEKQLGTFWGQYDRVMSGIKNTMAGLGDNLLAPLTGGLTQVADLLALTSKGDWAGAFDKISASISSINWGGIMEGAQAAIQGALAALQGMDWSRLAIGALDAIYDLGRQVADALGRINWSSAANTAIQAMAGAFRTAINVSLDIGSWIAAKLRTIDSTSVRVFGQQLGSALVGAIQTSITEIGKLFQDLPGMVSKWFGNMSSISSDLARIGGEFVKGISDPIITGMKLLGATVLDSVSGAIAGGLNAMGGIVETAVNAILDGVQSIVRTVGGAYVKLDELTGGRLPDYDLTGYTRPEFSVLKSATGTDFRGSLGGGSDLFSTTLARMRSSGQTYSYLGAVGALENVIKQPLSQSQLAQVAAIWPKSGTVTPTPGAAVTGNVGGYNPSTWLNNLIGLETSMMGGVNPLLPTGGYQTGAAAQSNAASVASLGGQWTGGVVPVYVTNMGAGGMGGSGGSYGANYGYGTPKQFTGNVTPGGPGIGAVSTEGEFTSVEIDTCQIDSFGMTPGLGQYLANAGVWKPIEGASTSEALANIIGYQGNYAQGGGNITPTVAIGTISKAIKQSQDLANKSQLNTYQQAGEIQVGNAQQSAYLTQNAAQMDAQSRVFASQDWSATNQQVNQQYLATQQAVGSAWANSVVQQGTATLTGVNAMNSASQNITAGGASAQNYMQNGGTLFQQLVQGAGGTITESGVSFKNNVGQALNTFGSGIMGLFGGGGGASYNTASGTWTSTSSSVGGNSSANYGGMSGLWNVGSNNVGTNAWWVGTGATAGYQYQGNQGSKVSWGGAAASNAARGYSGGGGYSGGFGSVTFGGVRLAEGGIVTRPTLAMIGEAGDKEAVVPLSKAAEMGFGGAGAIMAHSHNIIVDGRVLGQAAGSAIIKETRKAGMKVR